MIGFIEVETLHLIVYTDKTSVLHFVVMRIRCYFTTRMEMLDNLRAIK
jgi:hypothetical protein